MDTVCRSLSGSRSAKTLLNDDGPLRIEVPRDREGEFDWRRAAHDWKAAMHQFAILYQDRFIHPVA